MHAIGVDSHDPTTEADHDHALTDYTPFLDPGGMRGARIGVARNFFGFSPRVDAVMPYFGQERMPAAQKKGPLTDAAYIEALETNHRLARARGIDATLQAHNLDAIIAPSGDPACLTDWVKGDHHSGGSSSPAAVAGYPNITAPAGYIFGLPIGISFFAGAYQEPMLIKLAYAFEQATHVCRPPQFLPGVDFGA